MATLSASEVGNYRQHANLQILDSNKRGSKEASDVSTRNLPNWNYFLSDFFDAVSVLAFLSLSSLRSLVSLFSLLSLLWPLSAVSLLESDLPSESELTDEPDRFA